MYPSIACIPRVIFQRVVKLLHGSFELQIGKSMSFQRALPFRKDLKPHEADQRNGETGAAAAFAAAIAPCITPAMCGEHRLNAETMSLVRASQCSEQFLVNNARQLQFWSPVSRNVQENFFRISKNAETLSPLACRFREAKLIRGLNECFHIGAQLFGNRVCDNHYCTQHSANASVASTQCRTVVKHAPLLQFQYHRDR